MIWAISRSNLPLNFLNSPASVSELNAQITKSSDEYTKKIFGKTIKSEGFIEKNRDIYLFFNFLK